VKVLNHNGTGARCEQLPGESRVNDVVTAILAFAAREVMALRPVPA